MTDASELRAHLRPSFSDAEVEALWRGVAERRRGHARRAWLGVALPALAACALVAVSVRSARPASVKAPTGALRVEGGAPLTADALRGSARRALRLTDRSVLTLAPETALTPEVNDGRALEFSLRRGVAGFEVTPGGPRRWRIHCELATVTVVGTAFTLDRGPDSLRVSVSHGTVWVDGAAVPGGHRVLTAGQSLAVFRATPAPVLAPTAVAVAPAPQRTSRPAPAPPAWQLRARAGDARGAWEALGDNGFERASATSSVATLLELADVARRNRRHDLAAPLLDRFVREHPDHPEAAMAAFTLGRDELAQRHDPRSAARWFERALTLRPPRTLEEDLRARIVEARTAAGDTVGACDAARGYLASFPQGRHAERLRGACDGR